MKDANDVATELEMFELVTALTEGGAQGFYPVGTFAAAEEPVRSFADERAAARAELAAFRA